MTTTDLHTRLNAAVDANFARQAEWLANLVRFPSVRGEEAPCQDWIAREFSARGWPVDRYTLAEVEMSHLPGFSPVMDTDYSRAVQVVASLRAPRAQQGKSLILQGHVDVVPTGPASRGGPAPPFAAVIKDGRMIGRGANDMKSGVSAMVFALDALRSLGLRPRRRRLRADRDGGGEHRQRRALDAGARLPRRRLPHPGADRRPRSRAAPSA